MTNKVFPLYSDAFRIKENGSLKSVYGPVTIFRFKQ
jgi:hypothetical protein